MSTILPKFSDVKCPADCELFAAWQRQDGVGPDSWGVYYNESHSDIDGETGEFIQYAGMKTHVIAEGLTEAEAKDFVKSYYRHDAAMSQSPDEELDSR